MGIGMKIERNITVFAGETGQASGTERPDKARQEKDTQKNGIVYAGNFQGDMPVRDRIRQKKEQAQREAMKVVQEARSPSHASCTTFIEIGRAHV